MHFLTDLDPNERVKGSRDPLGIQSVWSRFARLVIGGITSQTAVLDDFRILVVGSWLLDQLDEKVPDAAAFVCWEQLASYARLGIAQQEGFRGITRVRDRYQRSVQAREPRSISSSRADQTLTNQAGYGIWGLYRSTAWATGLLEQQRPFVRRPEVDRLVREIYVPRLEDGWGKGLRALLAGLADGLDLSPWRAPDRRRLEAIAHAVTAPVVTAERELYRDFLLRGGPDDAATLPVEVRRRQRALYPLLRGRDTGEGLTRAALSAMATTGDEDLAEVLHDIGAAGAMLDASSRCFTYLTQQGDTTLSREVAALEKHFARVPHLVQARDLQRLERVAATSPRLLEAPREDESGPGRWIRIASALHEKDFETLLRLLVKQNEAVSQSKGSGAGWVGLAPSGSVQVSMIGQGRVLPDGRSAEEFWQVPYYFSNLAALVEDIEGAAGPARRS